LNLSIMVFAIFVLVEILWGLSFQCFIRIHLILFVYGYFFINKIVEANFI
jgi:hypothetical protein